MTWTIRKKLISLGLGNLLIALTVVLVSSQGLRSVEAALTNNASMAAAAETGGVMDAAAQNALLAGLTVTASAMTDVADLPEKQASRIDFINDALNRIDQSSHKNASSAKDLADASIGLADHAGDLELLMGSFQMSGNHRLEPVSKRI